MAGKVLVIKGADFSSVAVEQVTIIDPSAPTYRLTVTSADATMGTVTGGGMYTEGAVVNISAVAANGYKFVKWSDNNTNANRSVTIGDTDITLTATFAVQTTAEQKYITYGYGGSASQTRVAILIDVKNRSNWRCKIAVAENSTIKANIVRDSKTIELLKSIFSKDSANPRENITWGAINDEGWVTANAEREYNSSNSNMETLGMESIVFVTAYAANNTGYPTLAEINQYIQFTFENVAMVDIDE